MISTYQKEWELKRLWRNFQTFSVEMSNWCIYKWKIFIYTHIYIWKRGEWSMKMIRWDKPMEDGDWLHIQNEGEISKNPHASTSRLCHLHSAVLVWSIWYLWVLFIHLHNEYLNVRIIEDLNKKHIYKVVVVVLQSDQSEYANHDIYDRALARERNSQNFKPKEGPTLWKF